TLDAVVGVVLAGADLAAAALAVAVVELGLALWLGSAAAGVVEEPASSEGGTPAWTRATEPSDRPATTSVTSMTSRAPRGRLRIDMAIARSLLSVLRRLRRRRCRGRGSGCRVGV